MRLIRGLLEFSDRKDLPRNVSRGLASGLRLLSSAISHLASH